MKYIIELYEGQYTCYCDQHPEGACHSNFYNTPQEALTAFIEYDLPEWEGFIKLQLFQNEP